MDCCQCQGIERFFDKKVAAKDLKRYRKKGPTGTTRALIEALKAEGLEGLTLIDIGGGIGVIQHELMDAGVATATNVDASSACVETAREKAQRRGYVDRVTYHHGNFVEMASELAPADIVTLDKVICCYHDMDGLVGASSELAGKLYGVIYPRDTWVGEAGLSGDDLHGHAVLSDTAQPVPWLPASYPGGGCRGAPEWSEAAVL